MRRQNDLSTTSITRYTSQADISWEIDILGKNANKVKSAHTQVLSEECKSEGIRNLLINEVIETYLDIQKSRAIFDCINHSVELQSTKITLLNRQEQAGLEMNNSLEMAYITEHTLKIQKAEVENTLEVLKNKLAILLGCLPMQVDFVLGSHRKIPALKHQVILGLPLSVMQHRPDVKSAGYNLIGAQYLLKSQISQYFPTLTLSAFLGKQTVEGKTGHTIQGIGIALFQPLFDLLRINENRKAQQAKVNQAALLYKQTILNAYAEIENALNTYQIKTQQKAYIKKQYEKQKAIYEKKKSLNQQGLTSLIEVVDSQIEMNKIKQQSIAHEVAQTQAQLHIIKAIGR